MTFSRPIICPLIAALLYLCFWLPFSTVPDTLLVPSYIAALSMFAFSAWLESFAEPYVILLLRFGMDAQYAFAQGFLVITQRIFVLVLVIMIPMLPVYAFCCAQSAVPPIKDFSTMSLYPNNLAVFDAVDKLGSLVARIIFAPLEHSAYLYFSSCLRRTTSAKDQTEIDVKKGISAMNSLLHIVTVVGTVIFIFAISYSPLAIKIYGGSLLINNADNANILRLYCFYIIIIAINGIAECFAMATMDEEELLSHGWFLFLSSPIQIFLSSAFSYAIGAYGLILANIISMLMRIAYR
ncbi:unnamed protein product [Onchocerca flexuosa]|uniref:Protein RFT1 homolog n=1 Tax=Onchocerca flexuosa TaxID=387005 RepID=A0A3P7XUD1_9BILA|nr:unnamed protein product [Onchocerca flexuosa]